MEPNVKNLFSVRLKELINESGKSKRVIATEIGIAHNTLGYYIDKARTPDIVNLSAIANYFSVSADWLLGQSDVKTPNGKVQEICAATGLNEKSVQTLIDAQAALTNGVACAPTEAVQPGVTYMSGDNRIPAELVDIVINFILTEKGYQNYMRYHEIRSIYCDSFHSPNTYKEFEPLYKKDEDKFEFTLNLEDYLRFVSREFVDNLSEFLLTSAYQDRWSNNRHEKG